MGGRWQPLPPPMLHHRPPGKLSIWLRAPLRRLADRKGSAASSCAPPARRARARGRRTAWPSADGSVGQRAWRAVRVTRWRCGSGHVYRTIPGLPERGAGAFEGARCPGPHDAPLPPGFCVRPAAAGDRGFGVSARIRVSSGAPPRVAPDPCRRRCPAPNVSLSARHRMPGERAGQEVYSWGRSVLDAHCQRS
jgi:hypothetical protein